MRLVMEEYLTQSTHVSEQEDDKWSRKGKQSALCAEDVQHTFSALLLEWAGYSRKGV